MTKLSGKTALVTGASKGIGAAIAKAMAAAGANVIVNYASSKDGADKVVAAKQKLCKVMLLNRMIANVFYLKQKMLLAL